MSEKKQNKEQEKRIVRFRHKIIRKLIYFPLKCLTKLKYGSTVDRFQGDHQKQYLILYNHESDYDQIMLGQAFRFPIYYLAMEDILSNGFSSSVLRYAVAPIAIKKQTIDLKALREIFQVVKEGGSVAISPEGHRTYSGRPCYINPSIVKLIKKIKLPVVLFKIEGAYGVQPRWSDVIRKGKVHAYPSEVITEEEVQSLSQDALYERIVKGLAVDETLLPGEFHHKKLAEYLERVAYICPDCGISRFESENDLIRCTSCGRTIRYLPNKTLEGVGKPFPFRFIADWYKYQCDFINRMDPETYREKRASEDAISLFKVILYKKKELIREAARLALYGDRIVIDEGKENEMILPFNDVPVTLLGRNKLNIYAGDEVLQIRGSQRFNALKYLNFYNRWYNLHKGDPASLFLGM